jgi:hypothetical protein
MGPEIQGGTQDESGYYIWAPAGKALAVYLHLDVLDRLLAEVMRGFGAVPKRGAEVGGVLIGVVEQGDKTVVRVEDFEPVECGYTRGPSYQFTEEEKAGFADACRRWAPDSERPDYAVGYFRSHTRDGLSLAPEDLELMDRHFAGPSTIVLLVRPLITTASPAGFFFREDGVFPETTPLEFPFRRRDLAGEEAPQRRPSTDHPLADRKRAEAGFRPTVTARLRERERDAGMEFEELPQAGRAYAGTTPPQSRLKGWMWIPLSFVFLLLGVVLGFQAALTMSARSAAGSASDLALALTVTKNDQDLTVRWNRESAAIRAAQKGMLEIQDGGFAKPVELDASYLQTGNIIYHIHNASNAVQFRLTVYVNPRLTVSETLEWKQ